jgi:hypothetical protein
MTLLAVLVPTAHAQPLLPDLVADPPVGGNAPVVYDDGQGPRLLLRMDGFVHNRGPGPLEIRASQPVGGVMQTVRQRVYDSGGGFTDVASAHPPQLVYETNDDHDHWHLRHAMRYSLWSEDRTREVAPSEKVGFCLLDSEPIESSAPATYTEDDERFCRTGEPAAPSVYMGISPGWRDLYAYVLAFQWIDISDVTPGRYWLRADSDPDNVIAEADETNVGAYDAEESVVNGYRADPVQLGEVPALGAAEVTLAATRFDDVHLGSPGAPEFQIVTPPSGGTLDQPVGAWFAGPAVHYTPNPGFGGSDTFTFAARDASSPYPHHPAGAAVTLTVQGGSITPAPGVLGISNAPRTVYTRSRTQLVATGQSPGAGLTWATTAGRISQHGLFRAPRSRGVATISVRASDGARGAVSIRVRRRPHPRPAPSPRAPRTPRAGLSKLKLRRFHHRVVAVVASARTGRVRFSARKGATRFGGCSVKVRRGGVATCSVALPASMVRPPYASRPSQPRPGRISVRAVLRHGGAVISRRRARL